MGFWNFFTAKKPATIATMQTRRAAEKKAVQKVAIMTCKHCHERLYPGKQHLCMSGVRGSSFTAPAEPTNDTSNFLLSYIIADETDSTLLGYAAGGSLTGAMLGASAHDHRQAHTRSDDAFFNPSEDTSSTQTWRAEPDSTPEPVVEVCSRYEAPVQEPTSYCAPDTTPDYGGGGGSSMSDSFSSE